MRTDVERAEARDYLAPDSRTRPATQLQSIAMSLRSLIVTLFLVAGAHAADHAMASFAEHVAAVVAAARAANTSSAHAHPASASPELSVCNYPCTACSGSTCFSCPAGYYPSGSGCGSCYFGYNCYTCSSYYTCTSCYSGYYLSGGTCYYSSSTCSSSCSYCSSGTCYSCYSGYELSGGTCVYVGSNSGGGGSSNRACRASPRPLAAAARARCAGSDCLFVCACTDASECVNTLNSKQHFRLFGHKRNLNRQNPDCHIGPDHRLLRWLLRGCGLARALPSVVHSASHDALCSPHPRHSNAGHHTSDGARRAASTPPHHGAGGRACHSADDRVGHRGHGLQVPRLVEREYACVNADAHDSISVDVSTVVITFSGHRARARADAHRFRVVFGRLGWLFILGLELRYGFFMQ